MDSSDIARAKQEAQETVIGWMKRFLDEMDLPVDQRRLNPKEQMRAYLSMTPQEWDERRTKYGQAAVDKWVAVMEKRLARSNNANQTA